MKPKLFLLLFSLLSDVICLAQQNLRRAFQPADVVNKLPYGANTESGQYILSKDAKIYYEIYGNGQPIVLLHGRIFGSTIEMADFIDSLKPNFQVIASSKSQLCIVPNTGHVVFLENFAAVWAGIVPFLKN